MVPAPRAEEPMELFSLILVNLTLGVVLYFVFSLRLSRALEKAKAGEIPGDVRRSIQATMDNLQSTVEFVNTSIDVMEKKTTTFYRLVRRSEELTRELEELLEKTKGRRLRKKGGSAESSTFSSASSFKGADEPRMEKAARNSLSSASSPSGSPDAAVERVLARLRGDSLDLEAPGSSEEIFRSSALSTSDSVFLADDSSSGIAPQVGGFFSGIGKLAARFLGVKGMNTLPFPTETRVGSPAPAAAPKTEAAGFNDILETAVKPARQTPAKTAAKPVVVDRVEISQETTAFWETVKKTDLPPRDVAIRLLDKGHRPEAVAAATGMGLPELALLGALPRNLERPRRKRLHVESSI